MATVGTAPPPLPSPGVGARRKKGPKALPKLPASAFSPPNTGTSDKFPLPPSPSTVHPDFVIDANVVAPVSGLAEWNRQVGQVLGGRIGGVVLSLRGMPEAEAKVALASVETSTSSIPIVSVLAPLPKDIASADAMLASTSKVPINFVAQFSPTAKTQPDPEVIKYLLEKNRVVELEVENDLVGKTVAWEALGNFVEKAVMFNDPEQQKGTLVLSNVLPPCHDLDLPIVKLLTYTTYQAFQSYLASLSLYANVYVKFLPPLWGESTPTGPSDSEARKEWKRRIRMYLSHAVEVFGCQRILFGSSPSSAFKQSTNSGDWYDIARESVAELNLELADVNAVFHDNAKAIYTRR